MRIPASRGEQPPAQAAATGTPPRTAPGTPPPWTPAGAPQRTAGTQPRAAAGTPYGSWSTGPFGSGDQPSIYLSLVKRWQEAGRTLPGHPDEEWERLISQPCWPGR
ncbi:hypothetical protein AB0D45_32960 [Streptomyces sp. NPDC048352]|uniref:hypothetical protein n=1 Tax=Streptomyces sp. NPDC048352 TaxID=3154718 RepID=UPI00343A6301